MKISLTGGQVERLASIAREALPKESCAFLLGNNDEVIEILPMGNADNSQFSFSIEPKEVLRAYDLAESKGLHVIGIFHSHPANPTPSRIDRKFMEINPVVWLIYSSTQQKFSAYVYDTEVREVSVRITA